MGKIQKIKNLFLDLLSFGSPQAIVVNITSAFIFLFAIPTEYIDKSPVKCVFKTFLIPLIFGGNCPESGIFAECNCPACGITRGLSRLMHGDLTGAWNYNKLVPFVFLTMLTLLIFNIFKTIKFYKNTGKLYRL